MARYFGMRLGLIAAAVTLCTATYSATAPASYFDNHSGTATVSAYADNVIYVSYADYQSSLKLEAVVEHKQITRDYPAYRSPIAKPQVNIASLRPTSVSGWRSGRVRTLAG